jgi:eukaryotic-like serine/threonine-protein kinase
MKLCPHCAEPYADDAGFCPLDGSELVRSTDPFLGRTLAARYRLVRRVGGGGMAVVYLARHVMIERLSAIKILRQDLGMNASQRERFLREARAVNRINHPNIIEITDFGEDGGLVFLVMEYVEGESLLSALKKGAFEWPRAARVATEIASALGRAHELGVIHRDLKPENVLLVPRADGESVKLTDFGIAKIVDAPALTFNDQRFGTPGYIPPESVEGAPATARGDIYGLGVILYEMLTGKLPFDAKSPVDLLVLPATQDPVKPSARRSGIPPAIEELVLRMIARRPDDRPRDAFAVCASLEAALAGALPAQPLSGDQHAAATVDRTSTVPSSSDRATLVIDPAEPPADGPPSSPAASTRSWLAVELEARPIEELADRWQSTLAALVDRIELTAQQRGKAAAGVRRARDMAEVSSALIASLERARAAVGQHQSAVDGIEARGREFKGSLGHAIDALSRDRSRERAELDAIAARRAGIRIELAVSTPEQGESLIWEAAALQAQEGRSLVLEKDLGFQIETLQRQLETQNEQVERELAHAAGMLEGALSGMRRITGELVRTMAEAAAAIA